MATKAALSACAAMQRSGSAMQRTFEARQRTAVPVKRAEWVERSGLSGSVLHITAWQLAARHSRGRDQRDI
jgi:hypothetical protein